MKSIEQICAEYHGLNVDDLRNKSRKQPLVEARQQAMYFYRKFTRLTTERIGLIFNRDHSTTIYNCRIVDIWIDSKNNFNFEQKKNTQEIEVLLLMEGYNLKRDYNNKEYQQISLKELFYSCMKEVSKGSNEIPTILRAFEDRIIKTGIKWTEREK